MSIIETVCPFCKKQNAVEKSSTSVTAHGLNKIRCSHCSKYWEEHLSEPGVLAKSAPAPSSELAALRVQVRAQMETLMAKINGLLQQREAAGRRFQPGGVEKSGVAEHELQKSLANGKPAVRTSPGAGASGARFVPGGVEKNDAAAEELEKALARPIWIG